MAQLYGLSPNSRAFSNAVPAPVSPRRLRDLTSHPHRLPPARMHFTTPTSASPLALPHQPDSAPLPFRCPIALPSYHPNPTHDSSAPRRRSAPAERPSSCMVVRELSRAGRWPHRRASMGCGAPQAPSTGTRFGRPSARSLGVVAQEVRLPAVPSSPCRCPRPASGVQCPVRATSVHACLSTRACPGDRCPVSGAGV
jgi:hypothetical protein